MWVSRRAATAAEVIIHPGLSRDSHCGILSEQNRKFQLSKVESSAWQPYARTESAIPSSRKACPRIAARSRQGRAGVVRRRAALSGGRDAGHWQLKGMAGRTAKAIGPRYPLKPELPTLPRHPLWHPWWLPGPYVSHLSGSRSGPFLTPPSDRAALAAHERPALVLQERRRLWAPNVFLRVRTTW